jgi:dTDP-glucose 4,6-dehydratase
MIIRGLAGEALPVYGDGGNIRDWLHVADHAEALTLVLEHGRIGDTYNIGARCERSNLDVVERVCDLLDAFSPGIAGHRGLISFVADRPGHDLRYAMDPGKIERELGWRPREDFERGLAKTVRWFCDNRTWWQNILDRGYRHARIGLG